jgi:hypothetical protein
MIISNVRTPGQFCRRVSYEGQGLYANELTHAHCSILAKACNMVTLLRKLPPFPRLATFVGSTTIIAASRGGVSGASGALPCQPIDFNFPVRNSSTACRVLWTFSVALEVFKIVTAHSSNVVGGVDGTSSSSVTIVAAPGKLDSFDSEGGSAKAVGTVRDVEEAQARRCTHLRKQGLYSQAPIHH